MDLLGGYNSDSDSDESNAPVAVKVTRMMTPKKLPPASESKADKKKRVMGKKLLKLSSVLPEHILNQLQQAGGGKSKSNGTDDDNSDSSGDEDEMPRRKTTPKAATAPARDYSKDEGIMGLLSALSKSNASASRKPSKILGSTELYSEKSDEEPSAISSPEPLEKPKAKATTSEPLGAAFLTTTVETVVRKKKEPAAVRSIHGDSTSTTSVHVSNPKPSVPRPTARIAPPQPRVQTASSLRSAAPAVRHPYTMHAQSRQPANYEPTQHYNPQQPQRGYQHQQQPKKKKPLSRKRQMEQMLRAGKLDQVEGDHQLSGVNHVYTMEGDAALPTAATSHTSSAGVRVVPTGSYDPSLGSTSMSTDVTSRQKTTNQLNSLLANAASLESHRAQNPQYHLGVAKKAGSHRATAKRKYGW